jgi:uncharacterized protein
MSSAEWPEHGRPAIVVTGASSGIGTELARIAATEGLPIVLIARNRTALDALAAELPDARALVLDLQDPDAPRAIGALLAEAGLVCDVLVNNAGYGLIGGVLDVPAADQLGILDLNLRAAAALALAALPSMARRGRGGVLNVGSIAGFMPGPGMAMYYASKAALRALSEAWWAEMAGTGVTVTLLCPGPVRTAFLERSGARETRLFRMLPKATAQSVARRGWAGFRRGRRLIFPDPISALTARLCAALPRAILLRIMARLQRRRKPE